MKGTEVKTTVQSGEFCSQISRDSQERPFGTATQTTAYLLLEYPGAWGSKAVEESDLPDKVKAHLQTASKDPLTKPLLIKQPRPESQQGIRFFIARATEETPALYAFTLENYEALCDIDILGALAGEPQFEAQRSDEKLFLVCTNGRRDRCCAKFGLPVLEALQRAAADEGASGSMVWECSHVGGHRFAANVICLPHGLLYGHVDLESARMVWQSYQAGEIWLPNLRGRTCYSSFVQAAELLLREQVEEKRLEALRLVEAEEIAVQQWRVRFAKVGSGKEHDLEVYSRKSETAVYESCELDKATYPKSYTLKP